MKRKVLWGTVITLLIVLNVWRWWPRADDNRLATDHDWTAQDLQLRQAVLPKKSNPGRDLFFPAASARRSAPVAKARPRDKVTVRTAVEDPRTVASSNMAQYALSAVAKQGNGQHALVVRNGESHTVIEGDVLDGRYLVKTITPQSVELRDQNTGAAITLRLGNE